MLLQDFKWNNVEFNSNEIELISMNMSLRTQSYTSSLPKR